MHVFFTQLTAPPPIRHLRNGKVPSSVSNTALESTSTFFLFCSCPLKSLVTSMYFLRITVSIQQSLKRHPNSSSLQTPSATPIFLSISQRLSALPQYNLLQFLRDIYLRDYVSRQVQTEMRKNASKTPAGRSATFRVQGLGLFFLFLFFDLNCCKISCNISYKQFFEPSRRVRPLWRPFFDFFHFWFFSCFLVFLHAFLFIFEGSLHSGSSKVTRVSVGRDTNVFVFVKFILRPRRSQQKKEASSSAQTEKDGPETEARREQEDAHRERRTEPAQLPASPGLQEADPKHT